MILMNTDDTCDQRESRIFLAEATMADLSRPVTTCHDLSHVAFLARSAAGSAMASVGLL
jgi:hypothetical protein